KPAQWQFSSSALHTGLAIPSQINFVGKGMNLYDYGYKFSGSAFVIANYLRTSWLWDKVRVHGGAYGAFCRFNRRTGVITFVSYRDPNVQVTLDVYDKTAAFLQQTKISKDELVKSIIGTIGDIDAYMLADAKGSTSLFRHLTGVSDEKLQQIRDEILQTSMQDFANFAEALSGLREKGVVAIAGSEDTLKKVNEEREDAWLSITKVM
ncbi:MAG: peptidase M16, partial [Calditrichaeota bacterium]